VDSDSRGRKSPSTPKSNSKRSYTKPQLRKIPLSSVKALLETKAVPVDPGAEEMLRRVKRLRSTDEKPK